MQPPSRNGRNNLAFRVNASYSSLYGGDCGKEKAKYEKGKNCLLYAEFSHCGMKDAFSRRWTIFQHLSFMQE
jgi:hypothetical protein